MALPVENILQHFFQTDSLQNVSVDQVQQVINAHPYYDAAYFILAKKMQSQSESDYNPAIQKAALHFSNTAWLHFNLHNDNEPEAITTLAVEAEETVSGNEINTINVEEIFAGNEATHIIETPVEETLPINEIVADNLANENAEIIDRPDDTVEEAIAESYSEEPADDAVSEKLSSILQEQAAAFEKPVEASTEIPIENTPYHRVDYFDSQGIKLAETAADDKLGTQLKRFTDWLKQMKHVNPNQIDLGNDVAGETQVQNIARHSNEPEEIVTETMAEVLVKQGKPEQAIQIYEKLSLNNPSKTAYFAAKIQELKG